ncbi:hypothetical protein [Sphingobium sp.]|uniref:hypothetical protein n=1 Tax=Sphingobium sp. TaxID=1912891 RepID=UPI003BB6B9BA
MSAALHLAAQALITLAGLSALALILREFQIYADKAIAALLMGEGVHVDRP